MKSLGEQLVEDANAHARKDPAVTDLASSPPAAIKPVLDRLLTRADGYRDASLILLGQLIRDPATDISKRFDGDRTASNDLGTHLNNTLSVTAVKSAIGGRTFSHGFIISRPQKKDRGLALTELITWAKDVANKSPTDIGAAYHYLLAQIIATANDAPPFPVLVRSRLIHRSVCLLIDRMMEEGSGGAVEQYLTYGFLRALVESFDRQLTAKTKDRHASDAAAGVLGDIQIVRGRGNTVDVFEVTAHAWHGRDKINQAVDAIEKGGQQRVTILGDLGSDTPAMVLDRLKASGLPAHIDPERLNIQVLDLHTTLPVLVALLPNAGGVEDALRFAYDLIRKLPETKHAKRFVKVCQELGLVE